MARDIPFTEALVKGLSLVLDAVSNGTPLAYGAFARAPIAIAVRGGDRVRQAAREVGIQVTPTGFVFSIWQEADCDVIIAKLAHLKQELSHPLDTGRGSLPPLASNSTANDHDIPLTKNLFTRILAILAVIEAGHPDAFGAYIQAPISVPIRTTDVVRFIAGLVGIPVTRSGIVFQIWDPADCSVILSQLKMLQDRLVEHGKQRAEILPPPPSDKAATQ